MVIRIGNDAYGEYKYRVFVGTASIWLQEFHVFAYDTTEALDLIANYCEKNGLDGLYATHDELAALRKPGQSISEYADDHNLICCGNNRIYLQIAGIERIEL